MRVAKFCLTSICFTSCAVLAAGCSSKEAEAPPVPVRVGVVTAQDVRAAWRYSGEIRPDIEVQLAFKQAGYVESLHRMRGADGHTRNVQVGDRVPTGTILARLRPTDFVAAVDSATGQGVSTRGQLDMSHSDLAQAKADQTKADLAFERAQGLYAAKAMTRPDYDDAVNQHAQAAARVESAQREIDARKGQLQAAEAQVVEAKVNLSESNLTTTMPSLIVSRNVEPGSLVSNGTLGFTIANTRTVKVQFGVPDSILPQFRMDASVPVTVDGRQLTGHVTGIASSANTDSRVFNIEVSLPNKDGSLKPGMIAEVKIEQASESQRLPVLPIAALFTSQSGSTSYAVFVVTEENGKQIAHLRSIRVGQIVDRSAVIEEGLQPGEKIIVERTYQLADGSVVRGVN